MIQWWVFRHAGDTFTSQFLKVNISLAGQSQRHNFSSFSHKTRSYALFMILCHYVLIPDHLSLEW